MCAKPRRRSRKSVERLDVIVQAASREITEHGYDNLSVSSIASAAGLSVGGIYRYITTKADLLVMVCKNIYDGVREELGEIAAGGGPVEERLAAAIDFYLRECEAKRSQVAMVYREYRRLPEDAQRFFMQREQSIADVFADLVRAGVKDGTFRSVDATVLSFDIVLLGHLPSFKNWALRGVVTSEELRREQIALILSRVLYPGEVLPSS
ncbi:TetR/AcrR family transcriptional regulator [Amycolatopsis jejuensis]|uniref:TetR/AcrR family transcriptional regulator n=1 Tax=Amycolatopsis jejuensis TaxID=330084 RepID=UPI000526C090|nr:TetR/AcrR family transcriptional regulator [Amycolatopsis jejuensis]